jgi:ubiquinone/menaquinone biosynthesis C-methylase UbiE
MAFSDPQRILEQVGLSEGSTVADFGAGGGAYTLAAARRVGDAGRVYAIDIQGGLPERIKGLAYGEGFTTVEVIQGDVERIGGSKLGDASMDVVIIANMLFQAEDKETVLREAVRVVRPKGRILVVDWKDAFGGLGPHPDTVLSETEAKKLCANVGLVVEKHIQAGDHHYGLVLRPAV